MGLMSSRRSIGTSSFWELPMVFIDVETTGVSWTTGGEICEIGAIKVDPRSLTRLDELELKLKLENPAGKSEQELSFNRYNGFAWPVWRDAMEVAPALQAFNAFTTGCTPWAYNVSFEFYWLNHYYDRFELDWRGDYHWHCLMSVASDRLKANFLGGQIQTLSLSKIGQYLGLEPEPRPHRALAGARYEHQVYRLLQQLS